VNAVGQTVNHTWQGFAQRMNLCTEDAMGRNDFKHKGGRRKHARH
jgi:hypothetical protein